MGIYRLRNTLNNCCYVGSSCDLKGREHSHRYHLNKGNHHSIKLQRAWVKYGAESFVFEVIEDIDNVDMLVNREQHFIDVLDSRYNICPNAGKSTKGANFYKNPDYIAKINKARREWIRDDGYKQRMREKLKGRVFSEQHKLKLSLALKGKKKSVEHCAAMSKSQKGNKNGFK